MKFISRTELVFLTFILSLAAFLRFHGLGELSYHNDELSILMRCRYDSFAEFLKYGAVSVHPLYFQVGTWLWTRMVGFEPFLVRLPFVMMGIAAIPMTWFVGRQWFSREGGLLAAAAMALLAFPIYYSQIARPYAPGLFFCLLASCLFEIWRRQEDPIGRKAIFIGIGMVISGSLATGMHYFAMLYILLLFSLGFLILQTSHRKTYLILMSFFVVSYLPQVTKLSGDLSRAGLDWLGPPSQDWLLVFFERLFNESGLLAVGLLLIGITSLTNRWRFIKGKPGWWMTFFLFFGTIAIGYTYSILRKPVLQDSYLLFSLPLFFALIFSGLRGRAWKILVPLLMLLHTLFVFRYYSHIHHGDYKWISEQIGEAETKYGSFGLDGYFHTNSPDYVNFSMDLYGSGAFPLAGYDLYAPSSVSQLKQNLSSNTAQYFFNSRIKVGPDIRPVILDFYPLVLQSSTHPQRYFQLFSKITPGDTVFSQKYSEEVSTGPGKPFSEFAEFNLGGLQIKNEDRFVLQASVRNLDQDEHVKLAVQTFSDGETLFWEEFPVDWYTLEGSNWWTVSGEFPIFDYPRNGKMKIFLYSPAARNVRMKDLTVTILRNAG